MNLPLRRTADVLVQEQGEYVRNSGKRFGVERGTSVGATGIVAVLEQDTPAATVEGK